LTRNKKKAKSKNQDESDGAIWDKFDVFFGCFVVLNGILIGVQSDDDKSDQGEAGQWWFRIEMGRTIRAMKVKRASGGFGLRWVRKRQE
jgi:hypothetical protein